MMMECHHAFSNSGQHKALKTGGNISCTLLQCSTKFNHPAAELLSRFLGTLDLSRFRGTSRFLDALEMEVC